MNAEKTENISELAFEQAFQELEQLVELFERGQMSLSESVDRFERGMGLLKHCSGLLSHAEERVQELLKKIDPIVQDSTAQDDGIHGV